MKHVIFTHSNIRDVVMIRVFIRRGDDLVERGDFALTQDEFERFRASIKSDFVQVIPDNELEWPDPKEEKNDE